MKERSCWTKRRSSFIATVLSSVMSAFATLSVRLSSNSAEKVEEEEDDDDDDEEEEELVMRAAAAAAADIRASSVHALPPIIASHGDEGTEVGGEEDPDVDSDANIFAAVRGVSARPGNAFVPFIHESMSSRSSLVSSIPFRLAAFVIARAVLKNAFAGPASLLSHIDSPMW